MAKSRASKGLLLQPRTNPIPDAAARAAWLAAASSGFIASAANKLIYSIILGKLWPAGHGVPGPHITEAEIRQEINRARLQEGKQPYTDVFRRLRELQGEEGFICIIKEGTRYQLKSLQTNPKKPKRQKPSPREWQAIRATFCERQMKPVNHRAKE
jgi:hypothetical protein